jgi:hypothetical protein
LVAYVAVSNGTTDQDIRTSLKDRLPGYMVPAHFVHVDKLPLTVNGKIDEAALERLRAEARAPGNPLKSVQTDRGASRAAHFQAGVAEIWRDLLQTDKFEFDDNFFEVGGSSVHVVALHQRLNGLGVPDLKLIDLFEYTTVNALAKHLCDMERPS